MNVSGSTDLCRLALVAPSGPLAVALPTDVPVSDLLPTLLRLAGEDLADEGAEHEGWVLQRVGEKPLDEDATLAALGLADGDQVQFRPRCAQLPVSDFDDLIAGVSEGIRNRPHRWREPMTRWLFVALTGLTCALALASLLMSGPPHWRAVAAIGLACLCLAGGGSAARAAGDGAGLLLGCAAVTFGALGGELWAAPTPGHGLGSSQVLAALAMAFAVSVLAGRGIRAGRDFFLGISVATALGGLCALVTASTPVPGAKAGAGLLVTALAFTIVIPVTSFRIAGLRLPPLPDSAEQLQQDIDPYPAAYVLDRTATADRVMAALFAAVGAVCVGAFTAVSHGHGWAAPAFNGTACAVLLLRSRTLAGTWQRLGLLVPAVYGMTLLALHLAAAARLPVRLAGTVIAAAVLGGLLLTAARLLPGRRMLPHWGRAAEISELLLALTLLPLALEVLGVYSWAHSL